MKEIVKQILSILGIKDEIYCNFEMDMHEEFIYPIVRSVLGINWKKDYIRESEMARKIIPKMSLESYVKEYIWWCHHEE